MFAIKSRSRKGKPLRRCVHFLHRRALVVPVLLTLASVTVLLWHLVSTSRDLVRETAVESAAGYTRALTEFRTLYTSEVVERARSFGIEVTHDYADKEGAIPLPATLSMMLGESIAAEEDGAQVRLFSDYPFPWREKGGPQDDFERQAIEHLTRNPDRPFFRFESVDGRPSLRYAIADLMRPSCVSCHNSYPDTPKSDWKEGDVRGVLEVIRPLDLVAAHTRAQLRKTFILVVGMALLAVFGLGYLIVRIRKHTRDLTEKEMAERDNKALRVASRQNENLQFTLDQHAIVSIADVRGNITYVNDKLCEISGYAREELIGQNHRIVKSDQHPREFYHNLWRTISQGNVWEGEIKNLKKGGGFYWVHASIVPFKDDTGKVGQYVAIRTDITEGKKAEDTLKQAKIAADEANNRLRETVDALQEFNRLAVGRELRMIELKREINELMDRLKLPGHYDLSFDSSYRAPERAAADAAAAFDRAVDSESARRAALNMMQDMESARQQAEEASRVKSEFLANMSHELRTPMNSIMGFTHRLLKRMEDTLSERDLDALQTVDRNAKHLLRLINDILDLSKIEAGKMELERERFDLVVAVHEAVDQTAPLADDKPVEIRLDLGDGPIMVDADPVKLRQIVINLVSNGIKYTDQGTVTVAAREAEDAELGRAARIAVRDTGVGIKAADRERLFQKFTQLDGSATRKIGGTGLGLVITAEYVHMHGGRIEVSSEFGQGSEFTVWLPLVGSKDGAGHGDHSTGHAVEASSGS